MKTLIALTFLLFASTTAICQAIESSVENSKIQVINALNKSYSLGSPVELKKAFGNVKAIKDTNEIEDGYSYTYQYTGLTVYFFEHQWDAATISRTTFSIVLNGKAYKIGDHIIKLKSAFPQSYKNKDITARTLRIGIANKKELTDAAIVITYDKKGLITEIWLGNNNS